MSGASRIIAVDINPKKFKMARDLGATDFVDPSSLQQPVQKHIAGVLTPWGVDYSFDVSPALPPPPLVSLTPFSHSAPATCR